MSAPPLSLEIITILLVFLGLVSLISLLYAPSKLSVQGILNIVALAVFPIAYGIWTEKKWAFYATLLLVEPLILIYPIIAAFSPHFGIEYNWISLLSFVIVGLSVVPILLSNENYGEILKARTKLQTVIKKLPIFNALFIVFGVALIIRTVLPYDTVFKDTVRFASDDAVFHMRLVENALFGNHFPSRPFFDAYTFFPHGTALHFAPLFDQIIIFATWIISLGAPTIAVMEAVGAYYPAILGALVVFPVYIIGRELYNKYAGLIAAVLVATLPGQFLSRSVIGFTDHHIAETLLSTIAVMFLVLALKRAKEELSEGDILNRLAKSPREWMKSKNFPFLCYIGVIVLLFQVMPWAWWVFISFILFLLAPLIFSFWKKPDSYLLYACLAGMALGFYLLTWYAGLFFIFIMFAYGVIHYTINGLRGERNEYICITLIPIFLISLLMLLPFLGYPFPYGISHVGSLSIGLITFSIPLLYRYLITKFSYRRDAVSEKGVKAEAHKLPQKIGNEYLCPICGKKSKGIGIVEHIKTKHSGDSETKSNRVKIKHFFAEHPELSAVKKSGIEPMHSYSPLEKIARYDFLLPLFTTIVFLGLSFVFFPSIISSFGAFTPGGTGLTIAEVHPMDLGTAWIWFTTPFFIAFFAMAILAMNIVRRNRPEELLLLVWSIIIFVAVGGLGAFGIEGIG
ncbi:MAG: glycosyltransferase family 39 protein [Methanosarcinales archaeon]|nr:glycosyltransferase family 39 protein [Methanosarcinales archaeon]